MFSAFELVNRINESELRNNWANVWHSELFVKSAFDEVFNFDNVLKFNQMRFLAENSSKITLNSWENQFHTYWKLNKSWFFTTLWDWYWPDDDSHTQNHFLDAELSYKPNELWEFRL